MSAKCRVLTAAMPLLANQTSLAPAQRPTDGAHEWMTSSCPAGKTHFRLAPSRPAELVGCLGAPFPCLRLGFCQHSHISLVLAIQIQIAQCPPKAPLHRPGQRIPNTRFPGLAAPSQWRHSVCSPWSPTASPSTSPVQRDSSSRPSKRFTSACAFRLFVRRLLLGLDCPKGDCRSPSLVFVPAFPASSQPDIETF